MGLTIALSSIVISYFIGAIPFCFVIGKLVGKKRLTDIGDKNPGGWNLVFNVSKIWGIIGMLLDVFKSYFAFFITIRVTDSVLFAILAGCAAVAGHNYSPYLKFKGGKGIASTIGVNFAVNPLSLITFAIGIISAIFFIKNMIWAVIMAIVASGIFLWLIEGEPLYLLMMSLLLFIVIPKQINYSKTLPQNLKFRKEKTVKELFTPKIR